MNDGVVVASTATAHWAWVGVRLLPTSTPVDASMVERAWLAGLSDHGGRWEIRYTSGRPVSCVLLGRVHGHDLATVVAAAVALRQRLAATPGHVRAEPIMDTDEVHASLAPSDRRPQFELRKQLDWAPSSRRDTDRRICFAVTPLVAGGL